MKLICKAFQMPDRGFSVTVTGKKVYADYEIRDMTIRSVSVQSRSEYTKSCVLLMTVTIMVHCIYQHPWLLQTGDHSAKPLKLKHVFFTA